MLKKASELKPGDTFHRGNVLVKVLSDKEPCSDRFGQALFQFKCERQDTKEQGYCTFGEAGVVIL